MQFKISKNEFQKDGNCVIKSLLDSDQVNYNYDEIYLNHQFNLYNKDKINLILKDSSSQIIGFISARPHTIFLKDRKLLTLYADNLCVSQSYRHNNLAAILISNLHISTHANNFCCLQSFFSIIFYIHHIMLNI